VPLAEFAPLHVEIVEEPGIEGDGGMEPEINRGPPYRSDPRTHWIRKQLLIQKNLQNLEDFIFRDKASMIENGLPTSQETHGKS
jgi:hypothetical protein